MDLGVVSVTTMKVVFFWHIRQEAFSFRTSTIEGIRLYMGWRYMAIWGQTD